MRKFSVVIITLSIFLTLDYTGYCKSGSDPKDVLTRYLDANLAGDNKTVYECISEEAREGQTLEEFVSKKAKEQNELEKNFFGKVSYKIKNVTVDGDTAKAMVFVTVPDFPKMFSEAALENIGMGFKDALEGKKTAEEAAKQMTGDGMMQSVIEKFKSKDVPLTTTDMTVEMIKEKGAWKVCYKEQTLEFGKKENVKIQAR